MWRTSVLVVVLIGCRSEHGRAPSPHVPITCQKDEDCTPLPCGPCVADNPITPAMLDRECVNNPCDNPKAYCTTQHICAVKGPAAEVEPPRAP